MLGIKENKEVYRPFRSEMLECKEVSKGALFRMKFINRKAYDYENDTDVQLPNYGIIGMSGGGLWCEKDNRYFLIGIIFNYEKSD